MLCVTLTITWPDGSTETDYARGNTPAAVKSAAGSLSRSYQRDGATVELSKPVEETDDYKPVTALTKLDDFILIYL